MTQCPCKNTHTPKKVVLTGGPGSGKTAVLELVQHHFCSHVVTLHEAASILFGGGFPRHTGTAERAAAQRAIYYVQRELEAFADAQDNASIILCDRGTVDGAAYWPGPDDLWSAVQTTRAAELIRYDAVIHLRTPAAGMYNHVNTLRTESVTEAARIDEALRDAWRGHPRVFEIDSTQRFIDKAQQALRILSDLMPDCCRNAKGAP